MSTPQLPPAAQAALQRGNHIEAIKIVRTQTGLGLKEAKDQVDQYLDANPQLRRNLQNNAGQAGQYVKLGMVFVMALAIAAWYLFGHHGVH